MTIPRMTPGYRALPPASYLLARAAVAAHEAETFGPGLGRVRARDAAALVRMAREAV